MNLKTSILGIVLAALVAGCKDHKSLTDHGSITGIVSSVSEIWGAGEYKGTFVPAYSVIDVHSQQHCFQGVRGYEYPTNDLHGRTLIFKLSDGSAPHDRWHFYRPGDLTELTPKN